MTLTEQVQLIKNRTFEELIDSKDVLILINVASHLFYAGQQIPTCESCLRDYYQKIIKFDINLVEQKIKKMDARKYKPKWVGIKYVMGAIYNSHTLTDEQAESAILHGYLSKEDFEIEENKKVEEKNTEVVEEKKKKTTKK